MPKPVAPVVPGLEPYEMILGSDQPEYTPLPVLRGKGPAYTVYSRWQLTDEERLAILQGADIYLMQHTFGLDYQPTGIMISYLEENARTKEQILEKLGLDEELNERLKIRMG